MEIEIETILDCSAVHLGDEPARLGHRTAINADPIAYRGQFEWRLARMLPRPPQTWMPSSP
jgi:hypothetical protein